MEDKELVEVWRKQFESLKIEHACQRDYRNPELYWNDAVQHQWEGFLMEKRSHPSVVLPEPNRCYDAAVDHHEKVCESLTGAGIKYTIGE